MIDGLEVVAEEAEDGEAEFARFAESGGVRLRQALVARYGLDVGVDAWSDAVAYAWEHWSRVGQMANPAGYLYRVGQTSARRQQRWNRPVVLPPERPAVEADGSPALHEALLQLDERQRVAVILTHVYGWSYAETAELLGVSAAVVRNAIHRGMKKLRGLMEAER